jgi:hypothetical protein
MSKIDFFCKNALAYNATAEAIILSFNSILLKNFPIQVLKIILTKIGFKRWPLRPTHFIDIQTSSRELTHQGKFYKPFINIAFCRRYVS